MGTRTSDQIATDIENQSDPKDHGRAISDQAVQQGVSDAQEAAAHGLVDAVADKLEKDGFADAAEMVRSYKDTDPNSDPSFSDEDLQSALMALLGADSDEDSDDDLDVL